MQWLGSGHCFGLTASVCMYHRPLPIYTAHTGSQLKGIGAFAAHDMYAGEFVTMGLCLISFQCRQPRHGELPQRTSRLLVRFDDGVAGEFVGEYAGQIISQTEVDSERATSEYLWDLGEGFAVDAQRLGNATRRINHSDTPNVRAIVVNHRGVRKVCMYTGMAIDQGIALSVDYGQSFKRDSPRTLV